MIPNVEDILLMLVRKECTHEQALAWMDQHFKAAMEEARNELLMEVGRGSKASIAIGDFIALHTAPSHEPRIDGWCPTCKGSGSMKGMTSGLGPDDHEIDVDCKTCGGTGAGTIQSTTPQKTGETLDPTKLRGEERQKYIHDHDCPTVWGFFHRWSGGSKLCPSCLLCGQQQFDPALWAIRHAELPDIYICKGCVDNARSAASATACSERERDLAMMVRRLAARIRLRSTSGPHAVPDYALSKSAMEFLQRLGLEGSPLRDENNGADGGKQT